MGHIYIFFKNPPSIGLVVSQKGRTFVFSLESTFKWPFLCIYNLFNLRAAQTLDCTATEPQTEREAEDLEPFQQNRQRTKFSTRGLQTSDTKPNEQTRKCKMLRCQMIESKLSHNDTNLQQKLGNKFTKKRLKTPKVLGTTSPPEWGVSAH